MANQTIKILLLCNMYEEYKELKQIKELEIFVPKPPSCKLQVTKIVQSHTNNLAEKIYDINPDLIIQYGLGAGLLWDSTELTIQDSTYTVINDNHTYDELFFTAKYMYETFFDILKKEIEQIDLKKSFPTKLKIATTKEDLEYVKNRCFNEAFGFDTETNFLNPFVKDPEPQLVCFSIAWLSDEEEGWCIPTNDALIASGKCEFTKEEALKCAEEIFFESPSGCYIHNAAYDLLVLWELFGGKQPKKFMADTMLLLYLYHNASKSAALKENTDLIQLPAYKDPIKDWISNQPKVKGKKLGFEDVPLSIIGPYAAMDAIAVVRLVNFLKQNLDKTLWKFYFKIPHQVLLVSNELCWEGYTLSKERYYYSQFSIEKEIKTAYNDVIASIDKHIVNKEEFNLNSPLQLREILFKKLKLPVFNKTDKGVPATSQKALDDLILFHPVIFKLSKFRKLIKLYGTYIKGYSEGVLNTGSRVYKKTDSWIINGQYKQINRTARLASSNLTGHNGKEKKGGNVLTLPAQGSMIKHYFIPTPIAELENKLYSKIIENLSEEDKQKFIEAKNKDLSEKSLRHKNV